MTILMGVLSLAALALAICCTVLFAIGAAIELLPPPSAQPKDGEDRDEGVSFGADNTRVTSGR